MITIVGIIILGIIVDAGGGTIDLSAYKQTKTGDKTSYAECAAAQCKLSAAIVVDYCSPDVQASSKAPSWSSAARKPT